MSAHVQCYFEGQTLWFPGFSDLIDLRPRESWMSRRTIWISWFAKRRSDSPAPRQTWSVWRDRRSFTFIALEQPWTKDDSPHMIWTSKQFTSLIGGSSGEINLAPPKKKATAGRCSQLARGAGSCQDRGRHQNMVWMIWWFVVPGPTNISTTLGSRTKRSKRWVVGITSSKLSKSWPVVPCCSDLFCLF